MYATSCTAARDGWRSVPRSRDASTYDPQATYGTQGQKLSRKCHSIVIQWHDVKYWRSSDAPVTRCARPSHTLLHHAPASRLSDLPLTPDPLVGVSPFAGRAREFILAFGRNRETLLIVGDKGVGKSFLAAHIHAAAGLPQPLEALNCSIATERTCRLDLFGGEPPELTTTKRSLLELPTTVVLKHLDTAGPFLQERLAGTLRSKSVVRLRGHEPYPVAARIIMTLRKPVSVLRKEGVLTEGLASLLRHCRTLYVPPLKDRPEDILPLAVHYHEQFERRLSGQKGKGSPLGPGLEQFLRRQIWEDNVRDLVAYIRSLIVFAFEEEIIQREKLELMKMLTLLEQGNEFSLEQSMAAIRRSIIERAVGQQRGHQGRTAELLGLSDREIRRQIPR